MENILLKGLLEKQKVKYVAEGLQETCIPTASCNKEEPSQVFSGRIKKETETFELLHMKPELVEVELSVKNEKSKNEDDKPSKGQSSKGTTVSDHSAPTNDINTTTLAMLLNRRQNKKQLFPENTDNIPFLCATCHKPFSKNTGDPNKVPFLCSTCHPSATPSVLPINPADDRPYKCNICGVGFKNDVKCRSHERHHLMPAQCKVCDVTFDTKMELDTHKSTHEKERYKCSYCEKTYTSKHRVKGHERSHTNEKPYECMFCNKSFALVHVYKSHVKLHTGEKPYECTICHMRFLRIVQLRKHEVVHGKEPETFVCDHCQKVFAHKGNLKCHIYLHLNFKPFKCKVASCNASFVQRSNLRRHIEQKHPHL